MKLLVEHYLNVLAAEISTRTGTKISTELEDIIKNLNALSKRNTDDAGMPISDSKPWLPMEVKKMLLYIIFDGKAIIDTVIQEYIPEKYCTASSTISVDGTIIAKATKNVCFDEIDPFAGYSANKRNVIMRDYAYGGAETKALTNAGIGMDFIGDIKDYSPMSMETKNETLDIDMISSSEIQKSMAELDKTLNEKEILTDKDKKETHDEPLLVAFGAKKGQPLSEMTPNVLGWMLARIDTKQDTVTDDYANTLREMVNSNPSTVKIYEHYMSKAS